MAAEAFDLVAYLRATTPFDQLPPDILENLAAQMERKDYESNTLIYDQNQSKIQEVSLITAGSVEKFFRGPDGQKLFSETFASGDTFGAISLLLNNRTAIRSTRTTEPTTLFQMSEDLFKELCDTYPVFYDHFTHQFGQRMLKGGYAQRLNQHNQQGSGFQVSDLAFTQQVRDHYNQNVNTCTLDTSIQEAARSMTYFRQKYVVVVDPERNPKGLITDADLRDRVIIPGRSILDPVSQIMHYPLREVQADAYSYEAILLMFRYKVDYLVVKEGEKFVGMVSLDKLLNVQSKTPFIFVQSITLDHDMNALRRKWQEVPGIINQLVDRGTRPEIVNQIVSSISDAIAYNIIRRAIERLGPPPCQFVFMALGSEGRKEQTLSTDQDNAIIYEDLKGEQRERARKYFLQLGTEVCDELNDVGFTYCEGNLMAKNPKWNHSLSHWKRNYRKWIAEPASDNAVIGGTFFDCRSIYGKGDLLQQLRNSIFEELDRGSSTFFSALARAALLNRPPLTLFGGFQTVEENDRKGINIKRAMNMVTDFARIYALQHQLIATNTGERLRQLNSKGALTDREFEELHQGYYFLMRLRLTHQAYQLQRGESPDNLLVIHDMTKIEKVTIKEILRVIERYQKRLGVVFLGTLNG